MPEDRSGLLILSFDDATVWEAWLAAQPRVSPGLWLKLARKGAGAACVGKAAAIDGALVHG